MKIKSFYVFLLIVIFLLAGCNKDSDIFTIEDITISFYETGIHIKPQMNEDYPKLNGIMPNAYELLDDTLYIYEFNSENDATQALNDMDNKFTTQPIIFQKKNVLILYFPYLPDENYEKEIDEIVKSIK